MFHAYEASNNAIRKLGPLLPRIARYDKDLARQLRRAGASEHMNLAEGNGLKDGNRRLRFRTAIGSAREVIAGLEVAMAYGYLSQDETAAVSVAFERVVRLLWPNAH